MRSLHIISLLLWALVVEGQNSYVKIIDQGEIKGLERSSDGDFLIAGTKRGSREQDFFIARVNDNAEVKWLKQFGTDGIDYVERDGFMKTSSNTLLLLANSFNYMDTIYSNILFNFSESGEEIWSLGFEGDQRFTLKSVFEIDTSYVIIGDHEGDVVIQYVSKTGEALRRFSFESLEREVVKASALGEDGFCIVGDVGDISRESIFAMVLDKAGTLIWKDTFKTSFSNVAEDVIYLGDSWYIAGSTFVGPGQNNDRPIFYKIAKQGTVVAIDSIDTGGLQDATPFKMARGSKDNIIFVGPITKESAPNNWKGNHFYIGEINQDLALQWSNIIEQDKCVFDCDVTAFWPQSVQVYEDFIISAGSYNDSMFIIKSSIDGTVPIEAKQLSKLILSVYPNPASTFINIQFGEVDKDLTDGSLSIYQGGREVLRKDLKLDQNIAIDCSKMNAGLYYLKVTDKKLSTLFVDKIVIFR